MATLAEIRAKLQQQENRQGPATGGDRAIYAHWNIPEGSTVKFRFLPDGNPENAFFWIERSMIRLPFPGVKGQSDSKPVNIQVPCVEMWEDTCPILTEVRGWFKDPSLEDMGRKYWKKRSYLFQGFVRESPMAEDELPENPIRRFVISPQIFNVIKAALMDVEIEEIPTHYERGLDFSITKTSKGGYADYSTSKWARKESALTDVEMAAIETHGLFDLAEFLPKRPTEVELRVIKEMFEASVDGQLYDPALWGQYFKPYGLNINDTEADSSNKTTKSSETKTSTRQAEDVDSTSAQDDDNNTNTAKVESAATVDTGTRTNDILAMIRSRQNAN